jgi:hypothetical protein
MPKIHGMAVEPRDPLFGENDIGARTGAAACEPGVVSFFVWLVGTLVPWDDLHWQPVDPGDYIPPWGSPCLGGYLLKSAGSRPRRCDGRADPPAPCQTRPGTRAAALWGAPRIHGELLKLGIDVGQTSVDKYMARKRGPPSQGWKTFLRNHADGIRDGLVRGADCFIPAYVWLADNAARPSPDIVVGNYRAPDR